MTGLGGSESCPDTIKAWRFLFDSKEFRDDTTMKVECMPCSRYCDRYLQGSSAECSKIQHSREKMFERTDINAVYIYIL
jgi:hypothetical protein